MSMLVVFGAGASYDSVNAPDSFTEVELAGARGWQPPLTKELFMPRGEFRPFIDATRRAADLVVELRRSLAAGANLEEELDIVQGMAEAGDDHAATQLMALRFYLRDVLAGCGHQWPERASATTNYHWLVSRLDRWARDRGQRRVIYVTFNYDTILERAFADVLRQGINGLDDYVVHDRAHLYKPHGSVDWAQPVQRRAPFEVDERTWLIDNAITVADPGPIEIRRDWSGGVNGIAWLPALAVPIRRKRVFVFPDDHLRQLKLDLREVDRVLVVGWSATEDHFLELLADELHGTHVKACVAACGPSAAGKETFGRLPFNSRRVTDHLYPDNDLGFSGLVGQRPVEDLLAL